MLPDLISCALIVRHNRRAAAAQQLVDLLVGHIALKPVDMRLVRMQAQALRAISEGTEWLTSTQIGELAGLGRANPIGTVSRWKQQGRIFALRRGGKDYYPRYGLGADFQPLPAIKQVLATLKCYEAEGLASWFESTSRYLGGKRPREVLATKPDKVLEAARRFMEVRDYAS